MKRNSILAFALFATVGVWSCSESVTPNQEPVVRPENQLNVVTMMDSAPPLVADTVSFWARYNRDTQVAIYFADSLGQPDELYLRFDVEKQSLYLQPNGKPFSGSDSVLITIKALDRAKLLFEFQPSGIRFHPKHPAELRINYNHAGGFVPGDYDRDGDADADDDEIETSFSLWRQANPGDPFVTYSARLESDLDKIETEILEFSRYAVAY